MFLIWYWATLIKKMRCPQLQMSKKYEDASFTDLTDTIFTLQRKYHLWKTQIAQIFQETPYKKIFLTTRTSFFLYSLFSSLMAGTNFLLVFTPLREEHRGFISWRISVLHETPISTTHDLLFFVVINNERKINLQLRR